MLLLDLKTLFSARYFIISLNPKRSDEKRQERGRMTERMKNVNKIRHINLVCPLMSTN